MYSDRKNISESCVREEVALPHVAESLKIAIMLIEIKVRNRVCGLPNGSRSVTVVLLRSTVRWWCIVAVNITRSNGIGQRKYRCGRVIVCLFVLFIVEMRLLVINAARTASRQTLAPMNNRHLWSKAEIFKCPLFVKSALIAPVMVHLSCCRYRGHHIWDDVLQPVMLPFRVQRPSSGSVI